jgi:DNA-binding transcriptional regulator GbsR (MarR family)
VRLGHHPRLHRRGERREYFESLSDVWEIFSIIAASASAGRWIRLEAIKKCQRCSPSSRSVSPQAEDVVATRKRLENMRECMSVTNKIFQAFVGNTRAGLNRSSVLLKAM